VPGFNSHTIVITLRCHLVATLPVISQ